MPTRTPPLEELIVYACPLGELAEQLAHYFAQARAKVGANTAHEYTPHCTLTGFFHDRSDAIPIYAAAFDQALAAARPTQPQPALTITALTLTPQFHGLEVEAAWLQNVVADFATRAHSPTRADALRLKDWLHLSLAYGFRPAQHAPLAHLARNLVDPYAPAIWEVRLYTRHPDNTWTCHRRWPLD